MNKIRNGVITLQFVKELYKEIAIPADSVARAVLYTVEQPADVEIDEVVLRSNKERK